MDTIRVLLVEDDEVDRMAFARRMKELPEFSFAIAGSVNEGLEKLKTGEFNVLVTDYCLGDGTGLELLGKLREALPDKDIPVIFATGTGTEDVAVQALKLGACDYLIKDVGHRYLDLLPATIHKAMEERLKSEKLAVLRNAVRSISDAVFICDTKGQIQFANPSMGRLVELPPEHLSGQMPTLFLRFAGVPVLPKDLFPETDAWSGRAEVVSSSGENIPVLATITMIRDNPGMGYQVTVLSDLRDRLRTEQFLRQEEQRYKTLVQSVPGAVYRSRIDAGWTKDFISIAIEEVTGFPSSDFVPDPSNRTRRRFQDIIFPEDLRRVVSAVEALKPGDLFSCTFRILHRNGTVRWVLDRGMAVQDEKGRLCLHGVILDITDDKQREEALEKSHGQFLALAKISRTGILIADADQQNIFYANPALLSLAGSDQDRLDFTPFGQSLRKALETASPGSPVEMDWEDTEGNPHHASVLAEESEFQQRKSVLVSVTDLTEQRKRETDMVHRAEHDDLTGLPNRRAIAPHLMEIRSRLTQGGHVLGVLMIDLDNFKSANDHLGHEAGDQLLRAAAQRLQNSLRQGDLLCRYGGDEFLALLDLPEFGYGISTAVAKRMIEEMARPFTLEGQPPISLGISVGIANGKKRENDIRGLIASADRAMYEAKRGGGSGYSIASQEDEGAGNE
jgi:diguanylate cyclase (GGDEF)-like protein/PAS domain S-box-containing protein